MLRPWPLVEEYLDDDPAKRTTIEEVSERIEQIKTIHVDHHNYAYAC